MTTDISQKFVIFSLVLFETHAFGETVSLPAHVYETSAELPTELEHYNVLHLVLTNLSLELGKLDHILHLENSASDFTEKLRSTILVVVNHNTKALVVIDAFLQPKLAEPSSSTFSTLPTYNDSIPLKYLDLPEGSESGETFHLQSSDYFLDSLIENIFKNRLNSSPDENFNLNNKHIRFSAKASNGNFELPFTNEASMNDIYKSLWNLDGDDAERIYTSNITTFNINSDEVNSLIYNLTSVTQNKDLNINHSALKSRTNEDTIIVERGEIFSGESPSLVLKADDESLNSVALKTEILFTTNPLVLDIPRTVLPYETTQSLVIRKMINHLDTTIEPNNEDVNVNVNGFIDTAANHVSKIKTLGNHVVHRENANIYSKVDNDGNQWPFVLNKNSTVIHLQRSSNSSINQRLKTRKGNNGTNLNVMGRSQFLETLEMPAEVSDNLSTKQSHLQNFHGSLYKNVPSKLEINDRILTPGEEHDPFDVLAKAAALRGGDKSFEEECDRECDKDDENKLKRLKKRKNTLGKLQNDLYAVQSNISSIIELLTDYSELESDTDELFAKMRSLIKHVRTAGRKKLRRSRSVDEIEDICDNGLRINPKDLKLLRNKIQELSSNPFNVSVIKDSLCSLISVKKGLIKFKENYNKNYSKSNWKDLFEILTEITTLDFPVLTLALEKAQLEGKNAATIQEETKIRSS